MVICGLADINIENAVLEILGLIRNWNRAFEIIKIKRAIC